MQTLLKTPILLLLAGLLWSHAAEQNAVVNEGKINVRGQPALIGEVVTQLKKGDPVTVLEYVTNERAKAGEPTNWAKIKLPANTPVWVYAEMVKNGAVSATRLNLRAGPGDNYSVIGRLNRGEKVNSIRTLGDWMEIEAPPVAYAFVDASLVTPAGNAPEVAATTPASPQPETTTQPSPITSSPAPSVTPPVATATPAPEPAKTKTPEPPTVTQDALASAIQPPATQTPEPTPAPATPSIVTPTIVTPGPASPQPSTPAPAVSATPAARADFGDTIRRIVRREGIVRPTLSIQAPTWYELVHPQTKKTIDYLHEEKLGIKLKQFKGQKVIVSGEEAVDPRWPNTPILEIETLDIAP